MKKLILFLACFMAFMLVFSGCKDSVQNPVDTPETTEPIDTPQTEPTDTPVDYTEKYEDVLAEVYAFIENIEDEVGPEDGFTGVWDAAMALGDAALSEIGYVFKDLNEDGVSELLIGAFHKEETYTNNEIYMVYTLENEIPVFLLEGRSRSFYALKEDNSFYYFGSNGAAYSIFGTYYLAEDNTIACNDYYFTYPRDDDPETVELFHNTTGVYEREASEKLTISLDEFWMLDEEAAQGTAKLEATPFSALDDNIKEKLALQKKAPNPNLLNGEWMMVSGEVDGYEFTAEEEGIESGLTIANDMAQYYSATEFVTERFEANLEFLEAPLYYDCSNDIWSVKFNLITGDFGAEEEFYATLTDENTLLLQHFYPFDGTQGVSYQTYTRK
ncbi:MAG: hypothetical protein II359_00490 [Clostridia bacterium]|nr:hypothetical protein [Clostridia bacterium]